MITRREELGRRHIITIRAPVKKDTGSAVLKIPNLSAISPPISRETTAPALMMDTWSQRETNASRI